MRSETEVARDCRPKTRKDRFRAISETRFAPSRSPRMRANLRRLLEQLEAYSDETGTRARHVVLAERLGVSERTLRTWFAVAVEEGLVFIGETRSQLGRRRLTTILWQRVLAGPGAAVPAGRLDAQFFLPLEDCRSGRNFRSGPEESSGPYREDSIPRSNSPPESPEPIAAAEPEPVEDPVADQGREWEEARELLRARGLVAVQRVSDALRRRGVEPWAVFAVLRFYDAHRRHWGPGALYGRLQELVPGDLPESDWRSRWDDVVRLWPPAVGVVQRPSPRIAETRSGERRAARPSVVSAERVDTRQERDRRAQEWARTVARVERDYGSWFDSLGSDERIRTVEACCDAWTRQAWLAARTPADRAKLRPWILQAIESRACDQEVRS